MRIKGIETSEPIAGTASECLQHVVQQYGKASVKTVLVGFTEFDEGVLGQWLANDIRQTSRTTPWLYVALHLMGYKVQEFAALDEYRQTILLALALGGESSEGLCEELRITEKDLWPILLDGSRNTQRRKLQELADSYKEDIKYEVPLWRENLMLHLMLLRQISNTQRQPRESRAHSATFGGTAEEAADPRFATVASRLVEALLVTLAMNPDRTQLLSRSRHGKNIEELIALLQQLSPSEVNTEAAELRSDGSSAAEPGSQS